MLVVTIILQIDLINVKKKKNYDISIHPIDQELDDIRHHPLIFSNSDVVTYITTIHKQMRNIIINEIYKYADFFFFFADSKLCNRALLYR